jgi:hypothetical protein
MRFPKLPPVLLGCVLAVIFAAPASAFAPFQTGIHDPSAGSGDATIFDRTRDAGASVARTAVTWSAHVPGGTTKPAGFDARNPGDPQYDWTSTDAFVRAAAARDIEPLLTIYSAPPWAEGDDAADRANRFGDPGAYRPNAKEFGDFIHAAATRYSGNFPDPSNPGQSLPRVRYWQMWNEPNFGQYIGSRTKAEIPLVYSKLLNAGYDEAKGVSSSNLVLTAGLGPYGNNGHATDVEPQVFMRSLMCLTGRGGTRLREKRSCKYPKPRFDIWTQHPYTFGGTPTTHAGHPDSAGMGDMPEVKRTLDFARRAGTLGGGGRKRLWVTEFGWFSNPPGIRAGDGRELGLPLSRQADYLSESAYRLWRIGFEGLVWYGLTDPEGFPTGLYLGSGFDRPKPALEAFKLPFFADAGSRGVLFWGIVNRGGRSTVRIERRVGSRYRRVVDLRTDSRGMFYDRVRTGRGTFRARVVKGQKAGRASAKFRSR